MRVVYPNPPSHTHFVASGTTPAASFSNSTVPVHHDTWTVHPKGGACGGVTRSIPNRIHVNRSVAGSSGDCSVCGRWAAGVTTSWFVGPARKAMWYLAPTTPGRSLRCACAGPSARSNMRSSYKGSLFRRCCVSGRIPSKTGVCICLSGCCVVRVRTLVSCPWCNDVSP